jgi:hypothetical protein
LNLFLLVYIGFHRLKPSDVAELLKNECHLICLLCRITTEREIGLTFSKY